MTRAIFHHPLPLDRNASSGSGLRPIRMLEALEEQAEVWTVTGDSRQRARDIRRITEAMKDGVRFDLVYAEAATLPTPLTDDDRIPRAPFLDPAFLRACRRHGAPIGLFYRDVYWRFPGFAEKQSRLRRLAAKAAFHYDLAWYRGVVDVLYLPSLPMLEHVPISRGVAAKALPPGTVLREEATPAADGPLEVLYVGGVSEMYDIRHFVEALSQVDGLHLTVCTRAEEWAAVRDEYEPLIGPNTDVVHLSGAALSEIMRRTHISTVCVQPNLYRSFAAPVKLFDGVGMGIPVVASNGTHAANLVEEFDLGWRVDHTVGAMRELFSRLVGDRAAVDEARRRVFASRGEHTWQARAAQVIRDLSGLRHR